jgi:hypothetical protein
MAPRRLSCVCVCPPAVVEGDVVEDADDVSVGAIPPSVPVTDT